jgi:hypothetical protein
MTQQPNNLTRIREEDRAMTAAFLEDIENYNFLREECEDFSSFHKEEKASSHQNSRETHVHG